MTQKPEYTADNPPLCPQCGGPCEIAADDDWQPVDEQGNPINTDNLEYDQLEAMWLADDTAWLWGCDECGVDYPGRWPVPHYSGEEGDDD